MITRLRFKRWVWKILLLAYWARRDRELAKCYWRLGRLQAESVAQSNADAAKMTEMERDELRRENAALREAIDGAYRDLHTCIRDRWDECLVERAYFKLQAGRDAV